MSSSAIYDWTHLRRRQMRRKKLPYGIYWGTLQPTTLYGDPRRSSIGDPRSLPAPPLGPPRQMGPRRRRLDEVRSFFPH